MRKSPVKVSPENKELAVRDILLHALNRDTGRLDPAKATPLIAHWAERLNVLEATIRSWIPEEKKATLEEYLAYARSVQREQRGNGSLLIDPTNGELNDYDTPPPEQVNGRLTAHVPEALAELKYEALTTTIRAIKAIPHLYEDVAALRQEIGLSGEALNQVRDEMKAMLDLLGEEAKRRMQETARWVETMERHHSLVPVSRIAELEEENRMALEENNRLHARLERIRRASQGEE